MSYLNSLAISSIIKFKMLQDVGIAELKKKKKQGGNHSIKNSVYNCANGQVCKTIQQVYYTPFIKE